MGENQNVLINMEVISELTHVLMHSQEEGKRKTAGTQEERDKAEKEEKKDRREGGIRGWQDSQMLDVIVGGILANIAT